jgi:excisionase family DNA binding protein
MHPTSRLDSWKEIAEYLGHDVRTVIRWEREKHLPVHRVPGGRRRTVFAYTEEIEAWLGKNQRESAWQHELSESHARKFPILRSGLMFIAWGLVLLLAVAPEWHAHTPRTKKPTGKPVPQGAIKFNRLSDRLPWQFQGWTVVKTAEEPIAVIALGNPAQSKSMVLLADSEEEIVGRFVYEGSITTLNKIPDHRGPLLLVGGASHSLSSAAMAVLDVNHLVGKSSKVRNPVYPCNGCPPGRPLRYFIFPRSKLNHIAGMRSNRVEAIEVKKEKIEVRTAEMFSLGDVAEAVYEFSRTLKLQRTSFNDKYWNFHRELELSGKIHHTRNQCADRFGPTLVQSWSAKTGWTKLYPPRNTVASR